jgi:hypothetical protein
VDEKERLAAIKHQLAVLIRRRQYLVPDDEELPKNWWFGGIVDPRTETPFTCLGVWDFIAECLEDKGIPLKEIDLENPPGKKAYTFRVATRQGIIYVKLQFGHDGRVIGRSFHYSEREQRFYGSE